MNRARSLVAPLLLTAAFSCVLGACATISTRVDRTSGLELSYFWSNEARDKTSYFHVTTDGEFHSGGGMNATIRATTFDTPLSSEDLQQFESLVRATEFASRGASVGETGDHNKLNIATYGKHYEFDVRGGDPGLTPLLQWCRKISMRQFDAVLDAQPNAGPRTR